MPPCFLPPLAAGQSLTCTLAAGDELFCAEGRLQLQTSAVPGMDTLPGLALRLHAGQSWRAPAALVVQITALGAASRLHRTPAAPLPAQPRAAAQRAARVAAWLRRWRTLGA